MLSLGGPSICSYRVWVWVCVCMCMCTCVCVCLYWEVNHWPLASDASSPQCYHQLGWPLSLSLSAPHSPLLLYFAPVTRPLLLSATTSHICELRKCSLSSVASGWSPVCLESLPLMEKEEEKVLKRWEGNMLIVHKSQSGHASNMLKHNMSGKSLAGHGKRATEWMD